MKYKYKVHTMKYSVINIVKLLFLSSPAKVRCSTGLGKWIENERVINRARKIRWRTLLPARSIASFARKTDRNKVMFVRAKNICANLINGYMATGPYFMLCRREIVTCKKVVFGSGLLWVSGRSRSRSRSERHGEPKQSEVQKVGSFSGVGQLSL